MRRRTSRVTVGWALAGLWVTFIGWLVGNAAAQAVQLDAIAIALLRAVS